MRWPSKPRAPDRFRLDRRSGSGPPRGRRQGHRRRKARGGRRGLSPTSVGWRRQSDDASEVPYRKAGRDEEQRERGRAHVVVAVGARSGSRWRRTPARWRRRSMSAQSRRGRDRGRRRARRRGRRAWRRRGRRGDGGAATVWSEARLSSLRPRRLAGPTPSVLPRPSGRRRSARA